MSKINQMRPMPVNPLSPHPFVFLFPVAKRSDERNYLYDFTRHWWNVPGDLQNEHGAFALGIISGISVSAYEVKGWQHSEGKFEFEGTDVTLTNELAQRYFKAVFETIKNNRLMSGVIGCFFCAALSMRYAMPIRGQLQLQIIAYV